MNTMQPAVSMKSKSLPLFWILLLGLALAGSILLFSVTAQWGLGTNSDSSNYIAGARNILKGHGYRNYGSLSLITHWPPFYSFTLAVIGLLGIDPLDGTRLLHTVLYGFNILMIGLILKKITGSSLTAFFGSLFMLTALPMFEVHTRVCSEPWFIFFSFTAFYLLNQYLGGQSKTYFFGAAILTALACLDRYVGVTVIGTGVLSLFLLSRNKLAARFKESLLFLTISALPLGLWLLRNKLRANDLMSKSVNPPSFSFEYLQMAFNTFTTWLLPASVPSLLRHISLCLALAAAVVLVILIVSKEIKRGSDKIFTTDGSLRFVALLIVFMVCYSGLHIAHHVIMNASVSAGDRHFSPLFIAGLLVTLIFLDRFVKLSPNAPFKKIAVISLLLLMGFSYLLSAAQEFATFWKNGYGHTSRFWRASETMIKTKSLLKDEFIYTNNSSAVYLIVNAPARRLPSKINKKKYRHDEEAQINSPVLLSQLRKISERLLDKEGYVVFFSRRQQWYSLTQTELEKYLPITPVIKLKDGVIYKADPAREYEILHAKGIE